MKYWNVKSTRLVIKHIKTNKLIKFISKKTLDTHEWDSIFVNIVFFFVKCRKSNSLQNGRRFNLKNAILFKEPTCQNSKRKMCSNFMPYKNIIVLN